MSTDKALTLTLLAVGLLGWAWLCLTAFDRPMSGLILGSIASFIVGYVNGTRFKRK